MHTATCTRLYKHGLSTGSFSFSLDDDMQHGTNILEAIELHVATRLNFSKDSMSVQTDKKEKES